MNKRFLDASSQDSRRWIEGAESYVSNLDEEGKSWLLTKPFSHNNHSSFFYEMYQVLNLIEVAQLKENSSVLEVGSGPGWVTEILIKLGHDVDSIEPSIDMIKITEDRLRDLKKIYETGRARQYQCAFEEFDGSSGYYDCIFFHESLHHIIDERAALNNAFRLLRPGGKIAIDEYAWVSGSDSLEISLMEEMKKYGTLENPFTQQYLNQILLEAGFRDIRRFHMINGFFDQDLGSQTIEQAAQAPASVTNNLVAYKPIEGVATTFDIQSSPHAVTLSIVKIAYDPEFNLLKFDLELNNTSNVYLIGSAHPRLGSVFISLRSTSDSGERVEASYRNPLPHDLPPGERVELQVRFHIPQAMLSADWYLDMVAEHRYWFSDKGFRPVRVSIK